MHPSANLVPVVIDQTPNGERSFDIFSRLLRDRVVMLTGEVNDVTAGLLMAQLLLLESEDAEKPIMFYINSPGGEISSGFAILDTMQYIKAPVHTVCVGCAASMGAVLLAAGEPGHRYTLQNAEVMIHQPLGGVEGQTSDILIHAKHIKRLREKLTQYLAEWTGQDIEKVREDCDRDTWLDADEAVSYGLVDQVIRR